MVISDLCISLGIPVLVMILRACEVSHRFLHLLIYPFSTRLYCTTSSLRHPRRYRVSASYIQHPSCIFPCLHVARSSRCYFFHLFWLVSSAIFFHVLFNLSRNTALTLRAFWQRRVQFTELISTNSSLNVSRYIRLMLLALFNMTLTLPLGVFSIYINSHGVQLAPWTSWEDVHFNFSRVGLVPSIIWRSDPVFNTSVELARWLFPVSAFLFFALFGFASEAQKQYRTLFNRCHKALGLKSATRKPSKIPYLPRSVFFSVHFSARYDINHSITSSYNWTHPDRKTQSEYDSKDLPSGKASRFSLTSSNDATYRGDDLDIEKSSGLGSPTISTTCTTISCSPSSYPSASQFDIRWSPPPPPRPVLQ